LIKLGNEKNCLAKLEKSGFSISRGELRDRSMESGGYGDFHDEKWWVKST
jgi:hypothetical protein